MLELAAIGPLLCLARQLVAPLQRNGPVLSPHGVVSGQVLIDIAI